MSVQNKFKLCSIASFCDTDSFLVSVLINDTRFDYVLLYHLHLALCCSGFPYSFELGHLMHAKHLLQFQMTSLPYIMYRIVFLMSELQ